MLPLMAPASLPAALRADAPALDVIFIEGYTGQTVIGIHESEFHRPQPLVIDVHAGVPRARACDTDCIADTIDYGEVRHRLDRLMVEHGITLLEAFAEKVADILLLEFRAHWVRVKVVKPRKFDNVQAVGVMIERRRSQPLEPVGGSNSGAILHHLGRGLVPGDR